ncbi:DUF4870 domain-containing protein [Acidithiobacillus thiooxidans]|jgi:uncharacterized Tic20 family protein|uniref:Membrane protein n=1 Tax=Acidithiobacillus thiooxidans ATCC 19377 TaxID=637390 RepID=A0A5P9XTW5_ACITH|nr:MULTISPECIES: DUF4870 domain-containing protein [Acidithiobacillus]MBE7566197.1 DUF4870 domain-containing protein [Acidithiobacillus sp. HP-11]MBU2740960.1 DUF4870 domain-containing protein [Acidithiobacillus albertensis]MBU2751506.1 DUF4870 domain-containing protein [Acidithiobacillus thiooxidans]MBU2793268.1 DUF4870 domain-containing protein [Acidithiobacillus thiooxidans]MBU2835987.1 DUF4870 domain-containing protein [Acidithiobacillus thiooxidans]
METSSLVTSSNKEDRNIMALIQAGGILFGFLPALIVYLIKKDGDNQWLITESKEALNFQITILLAYIVASVLSALLIGIFIFPLVFLFNLVFCIIAALKSSRGEGYRYPLTLRLLS